jgi:hypothetical protein
MVDSAFIGSKQEGVNIVIMGLFALYPSQVYLILSCAKVTFSVLRRLFEDDEEEGILNRQTGEDSHR